MDVKKLTEEEKFNNGDWADEDAVESLTGLTFEECCHKFDWSREAKWNPAPLNGQNITIRFRKKKDADHE